MWHHLRRTSLLLVLLLALAKPQKILGAESAIAVSPAIIEGVVQLGIPTIKVIRVENTTNFPLPIKVQSGPFLTNEVLDESIKASFNASRWFMANPADFILQPREVKNIEITVVAPSDAEPGGHYATIFFEPLIPAEVVSQSSTISLARVGVLSFLIVPGDIQENLTLLSTDFPSHKLMGPVDFNYTLQNEGSIHLSPTGELTIENMLWRNTQPQTISLPSSIILPHTEKNYTLKWDKKWIFGKYQATLNVRYGNGQQIAEYSKVFWVIPWHLIIPLLLVLTIIIKMFIVGKKRLLFAYAVLVGKHPISKE